MLALSLMWVLVAGDSALPAVDPAKTAPTASIDLYVFEDGAPQANLSVEVGGALVGSTDVAGSLSVMIPAGRQLLQVRRGATVVMEVDLLTDEDEIVRIIASLRSGKAAELDIESSGRTAPLALHRGMGTEDQEQKQQTSSAPGALVGKITSSEAGEPISNARIFFSGVSTEGRTDENGQYAVELPSDLYSVSVVHPDYATQTIENVRVIPGREVTANIELNPAGVRLQDYVVSAPYIEGSIASSLDAQRETSSVVDVLGAEQMAATGDSDAAEALQRVSGLTIQEGKFVLVRGQPSRYTLTLWNGSPLPSPEPLVRTIPLDLFPTGVLSGIEVQKSYTADRLASFGSGLVNLQTRGVPEEGFVSLTLSGGYNSESTFLQGLSYRGGSLDLLGYDDGTRAFPEPVQASIDAGEAELPQGDQEALQAIGRSFSNNYNQEQGTLPPDLGLTLTAGNSVDIAGGGKLGAVASAKWGSSWREQIRIQRSFADNDGPVLRDDFLENRTDFNADIGTLLTVRAAWERHEVSSNTFYAHQTQQRTELTTGFVTTSDRADVRRFLLSWIERELLAQQLVGHSDFKLFRIDYRGMYAAAGRYAPDRREYEYRDPEPTDGIFTVFGNSGMSRQWDTVDDAVWSFGLDVTIPVLDPEDYWLGLEAKLGAAGVWQDRQAIRRIYRWRPDDEAGADRGETNPEILYDPEDSGDTLVFGDFSARQQDDSIGFLYQRSGYALLDVRLGSPFRVVAGLRYESAEQEVTTFTESVDEERAVVGGFVQERFFPSLSGTWFATDEMQVRVAYGQTTAFPNLNELSTAQFTEPDSGEVFFGDSELEPALIDGVDLRWEWYPSSTESLTFGGFWKRYSNPIERTFINRAGSGAVGTFQNANSATILGLEVGGRFELANIRDWVGGPKVLDNLFIMGNLALMTSEVELARQGIATSLTRTLDGQADFAFNAQVGYSGKVHDVTVAFNTVGTRLHRAGIEGLGDVFLQPVSRLDIVWNWRVWENDRTIGTFRLSGSNLTNPKFTWLQDGEVWREFDRGLNIGADFKLTFR